MTALILEASLLAQEVVPPFGTEGVLESEVFTLVLGATCLLVARRLFKFAGHSAGCVMMAGLWTTLMAYVCTVLEGVMWWPVFNCVEHIAYAGAACLFAVGLRILITQGPLTRESNRGDRP